MEHINLWPYVVSNIISDDIEGDVYVEIVLELNFKINDSVDLLRKNCYRGPVDIGIVMKVLHND